MRRAYFQKGVTTLDSRKLYEAMGHKIVEFKGLFGPAMVICIYHEKNLLLGAGDRSPGTLYGR